jgi:hypothetical protein
LQMRQARRKAKQERERRAVEERVAAALRQAAAAASGGRPDYLDKNYAGQRQQRQQRGAWRPRVSRRLRRPDPGPERYAA